MKLLAPIKNDEDIVNKKYVDSIDIGSRNIVTGTANMVIGSGKWAQGHWRQSGTGTIETIDISDSPVAGISKGIKITASSTSQNGIAQDLIPLNNNNTYTLSCWVRGSSPVAQCRLQPYYDSSTDTGGIKTFTLTGEWQYISYTTIKNPANTANYSGAYVYLIPSAAGDTLEVCGIKLERGNKATDWSPAPEDLATEDCITDLSASGTIVTYTKKDGSTGTITTQDTHYKTGLKVGASATATTNAAATNGNVYLNVLDDSTVRDSHNIVGSGSTTVTSDANGKITVNSTDTKVSISPAEEKSAKTYYPTIYESTNGTSVALNSIKDCNVVVINGTKESVGYSVLRLGNDTASGIAGNKYGQLTLYSKSSGYSALRSADTTEVVSHMLPATGGTILNTGTTSFTRSLTSGTKIGSIKINNTSTDIYAPTNTDTKVTAVENHYTPSADSSAALSTSASGATAAWSIDVVKGITISRDAKGHVTGVSVTSGKIPANPNTDTKVTQTVTASNAAYPLLLAPSGQTATTTTTSYFDSGVTLNPSTNTIAANISGNAASATKVNNALDINGVSYDGSIAKDIDLLPFIVGTQTTATGTWTGNAPTISALFDGLTIRYWLPYAGSGNATLNLTLADGTDTGNIYCYYGGTSRLSTHYGAGNIITLTYRENITIAGSEDTYTGWWADANYNVSNTAGSTNTKSKIFLIGATSQKTATTTYSRNNIYANSDNCLYLDNNSKVNSYFTSKQTYTDSNNKNVNHQIQFGISSSGNRGIYDSDMKWLIYANTSNKVIVNGDIVTGAISETSSSWTGTGGYTFNYVTGRNRALILAWMDYISTYTSFACISINSSTTISSTLLLEPSSTTGLYYSVSKGNIDISGGAGGASYKCTVLWFTV